MQLKVSWLQLVPERRSLRTLETKRRALYRIAKGLSLCQRARCLVISELLSMNDGIRHVIGRLPPSTFTALLRSLSWFGIWEDLFHSPDLNPALDW
jgi:hypothetical protein